MKPWKLLSVLLEYPEAELLAAHDELERAAAGAGGIESFLAWQRRTTLAELREAYVKTFDFDPQASLYLTYHTHGDRRQRGLELVRLKRRYREAGLPLADNELPDYLPAMLEFAALAPQDGEALLREFRAPLELVRARLHEARSPYADLLDALTGALPKPTRAEAAAARRLAEEGPPTELVGLEQPFSAAERSRMVSPSSLSTAHRKA